MSKKVLLLGAFLAIGIPFSAQAQGVPAGMAYGGATGYQIAGPVGWAVGAGVGGVVGGVGGVFRNRPSVFLLSALLSSPLCPATS